MQLWSSLANSHTEIKVGFVGKQLDYDHNFLAPVLFSIFVLCQKTPYDYEARRLIILTWSEITIP